VPLGSLVQESESSLEGLFEAKLKVPLEKDKSKNKSQESPFSIRHLKITRQFQVWQEMFVSMRITHIIKSVLWSEQFP